MEVFRKPDPPVLWLQPFWSFVFQLFNPSPVTQGQRCLDCFCPYSYLLSTKENTSTYDPEDRGVGEISNGGDLYQKKGKCG